jgi:hypothetical protein
MAAKGGVVKAFFMLIIAPFTACGNTGCCFDRCSIGIRFLSSNNLDETALLFRLSGQSDCREGDEGR